MTRHPLLRRLVIALIGLAMAMPAALPRAVAAPADGLPAALAFICGSLGGTGDGDQQGGQAGSDHQSCQSCTGACHGMVLAADASVAPLAQSWTAAFAVPPVRARIGQPDLSGYASRAPPAV